MLQCKDVQTKQFVKKKKKKKLHSTNLHRKRQYLHRVSLDELHVFSLEGTLNFAHSILPKTNSIKIAYNTAM